MRRIAIIGGGIAGLTAACELARLARSGAPVEAVLFESSHRFGGLIETVREGGFTVECGPDGWVSAKPWAAELATELGLAGELIPSNDATRRTHIFLTTPSHPSGRLVPMPDGLNVMVPTNLDALDGSPLFTESAIAAYRAEPARAAAPSSPRFLEPRTSNLEPHPSSPLSVPASAPSSTASSPPSHPPGSASTPPSPQSPPTQTERRQPAADSRITKPPPPTAASGPYQPSTPPGSTPPKPSTPSSSQPRSMPPAGSSHRSMQTPRTFFHANPVPPSWLPSPIPTPAASHSHPASASSSHPAVASFRPKAALLPPKWRNPRISLLKRSERLPRPAFCSPAPSSTRSSPTASRPTAAWSASSSAGPLPTASPAATDRE